VSYFNSSEGNCGEEEEGKLRGKREGVFARKMQGKRRGKFAGNLREKEEGKMRGELRGNCEEIAGENGRRKVYMGKSSFKPPYDKVVSDASIQKC
jgi:hypothetical protein